jgi:hypothetical protein
LDHELSLKISFLDALKMDTYRYLTGDITIQSLNHLNDLSWDADDHGSFRVNEHVDTVARRHGSLSDSVLLGIDTVAGHGRSVSD